MLFFVIAPGTLAVYIPWSITGWHLKSAFLGLDALRVVGAALVFLGLIPLVESFARFVWKGFGTPAPVAPPTKLVVCGFYSRVRNPIYVALVAIIIGEALILGDERMFVYAAILWLFFHVWVVVIEEPTLDSSFGDEFAFFKANVPRWLPRLTPWAGPASSGASPNCNCPDRILGSRSDRFDAHFGAPPQ
ncbi:methyltransferase family protein [Bradyrhizobium glycinis]|uniref:methyltransferase family protein n=1 Tax=Bradyrhizobium glycinis TaxID=2751812 RepID=UPI001FE4B855|nr:isoprenylcysteine carboxylmethyltransferase family protein [Bradyrhizobium glycinis]